MTSRSLRLGVPALAAALLFAGVTALPAAAAQDSKGARGRPHLVTGSLTNPPEWVPQRLAARSSRQVLSTAPARGAVKVTTVRYDPANPKAAPTFTTHRAADRRAASAFVDAQLSRPETLAVEVDPERRTSAIGDPRAVDQYQHQPQFLDTEAAWATTNGAGTVVAVVDTGVDGGHPDLAGQVLPGVDMVNEIGQPGSDGWNDDVGHGTHVAGIIAARDNNGIGGAGVAPGVKILPVRALSMFSGNASAVARGIVWAVDHGADVINLSLGGSYSVAEEAAVGYAQSHDVVVVAASGNDGNQSLVDGPSYPAGLDGVTSVGALNSADRRAPFSSADGWVDVAAPGAGVPSTLPGNRYATWDGTSMAAPMVAGAAALVRAANPALTQAQVRAVVAGSARDRDVPGRDDRTGYGSISAHAAVIAAAGTNVPALASPTVTLTRTPPGAGADAGDTEVRATLGGGGLGAGERVMTLGFDSTLISDQQSDYGAASWEYSLQTAGLSGVYLARFPGDDLSLPAEASQPIVYGPGGLHEVDARLLSAARMPCPDLGDETCVRLEVEAGFADGTAAFGTPEYGIIAGTVNETSTLHVDGDVWRDTVIVPDSSEDGFYDLELSVWVFPQPLTADVQIVDRHLSSFLMEGAPTAPAKPSMRLELSAPGLTYRESGQLYLLDGVPFGTCADVDLRLARSDGTAAAGPREAVLLGLESGDVIPVDLSPDGDHWTGTAAACPSVWSEVGEVFVAFYLGSDVESAAVAYDAAALVSPAAAYSAAWTSGQPTIYERSSVKLTGRLTATAGLATDFATPVTVRDGTGKVVDVVDATSEEPASRTLDFEVTVAPTVSTTYTAHWTGGGHTAVSGRLKVTVLPRIASGASLRVTPQLLTYGGKASFIGAFSRGGKPLPQTPVRLCHRDATTARACQSVTTNSSGKVALWLRPIRSASYWLEYAGNVSTAPGRSTTVAVGVRARLAASSPARGRLRVDATPDGTSFRVILQRRSGVRWTNVRTVTTNSWGEYAFAGLPAGTYRAVFALNASYRWNVTGAVAVR